MTPSHNISDPGKLQHSASFSALNSAPPQSAQGDISRSRSQSLGGQPKDTSSLKPPAPEAKVEPPKNPEKKLSGPKAWLANKIVGKLAKRHPMGTNKGDNNPATKPDKLSGPKSWLANKIVSTLAKRHPMGVGEDDDNPARTRFEEAQALNNPKDDKNSKTPASHLNEQHDSGRVDNTPAAAKKPAELKGVKKWLANKIVGTLAKRHPMGLGEKDDNPAKTRFDKAQKDADEQQDSPITNHGSAFEKSLAQAQEQRKNNPFVRDRSLSLDSGLDHLDHKDSPRKERFAKTRRFAPKLANFLESFFSARGEKTERGQDQDSQSQHRPRAKSSLPFEGLGFDVDSPKEAHATRARAFSETLENADHLEGQINSQPKRRELKRSQSEDSLNSDQQQSASYFTPKERSQSFSTSSTGSGFTPTPREPNKFNEILNRDKQPLAPNEEQTPAFKIPTPNSARSRAMTF
jgi:hypothetical protein